MTTANPAAQTRVPVTPPSQFPAVRRLFSETITAHEGVLLMRTGAGRGVLIGSQFGVTPPALALFRGVDPYTLTNADMHAITRDLAVSIGVKLYYDMPNFDLLPWDQIVAGATDKAWGSGRVWGVKLLQRLIGGDEDDIIGTATVGGYRRWKVAVGLEERRAPVRQGAAQVRCQLVGLQAQPGLGHADG